MFDQRAVHVRAEMHFDAGRTKPPGLEPGVRVDPDHRDAAARECQRRGLAGAGEADDERPGGQARQPANLDW